MEHKHREMEILNLTKEEEEELLSSIETHLNMTECVL